MTSPADMPLPRGRRAFARSTVVTDVTDGWTVAPSDPGADKPPAEGWLPARVPGCVSDDLRRAGMDVPDLDENDWWWRTTVAAPPAGPDEELVLLCEGITPPGEVYVDGELVGTVTSMFLPVAMPLAAGAEITVRCAALGPLLAAPRRPRSRWRTAVADNGLRFVRTTLFGRAQGFAPGPPVIGLWRPVVLIRRRGLAVDQVRLLPSVQGDTGHLDVRLDLRGLGGVAVESVTAEVTGATGTTHVPLSGAVRWTGTVDVPDVQRWWPHTHGEPALYDVAFDVRTSAGPDRIDAGRVGFRSLSAGPTPAHAVVEDGLALHVNDVPVFARGAVWTRPGGPVGDVDLRAVLRTVRDAGMNMLRIPGTAVYETAAMHDLCDELGILLWQDAMLANFDYPAADDDFLDLLKEETSYQLATLAGRASYTVFCGGSEVEQQAAMVGQDPVLAREPLTADVLPGLLAASGADAVWVPSSPCGGDLPFHPARGIAHYYGVGGYRRQFSDVRTSGVRFASECLALSNVPDETGLTAVTSGGSAADVLASEAWQAGVPRDRGADWDFEDVRDFYLAMLHGLPADELRAGDPQRYLDLSRHVSGAVMAEVVGEWRRNGSGCGGALVLWLADLVPGAGWGLLDSRGRPKSALHALRRAFAPVAVWMTDEGLNGVDVHVTNDGPQALAARLTVALFRTDGVQVDHGETDLDLAAHSASTIGVEAVLGHFVDASWAYRFGPPGHEAIVATVHCDGEELSRSVRFVGPARPPARSAADLGIDVATSYGADGPTVTVSSRLLLAGVGVDAAGHCASDSGFFVTPGGSAEVRLRPDADAPPLHRVRVSADNLLEALTVSVGDSTP